MTAPDPPPYRPNAAQFWPESRKRAAHRLLYLGMLVFGMGQTMLMALLPAAGRQIGLNETEIGSVVTASAVCAFLSAPLWGRRSDRWGRKRVILIGHGAYAVTTTLFALGMELGLSGALMGWAAYFALVIPRILFGIFAMAIHPGSGAYIADSSTPAERTNASAMLGAAMNIGTILGPAVGALIAVYDLVAPLFLAAAISVGVTVTLAMRLPETERLPAAQVSGRLSVRDPRILPFVILAFTVFLTAATTNQTAGFFIQDRLLLETRAAAQMVGISLAASAAASILAQIFIVRRLRLSPMMLIRIGMPVALAAQVVLILGTNAYVLIAGYALFGGAMGMMTPGVMSGASLAVRPEEQGRLAGLIGAMPPLGFAVGPMLGAMLYQAVPLLVFGFNVALLAALSLYVFRLQPHRPA